MSFTRPLLAGFVATGAMASLACVSRFCRAPEIGLVRVIGKRLTGHDAEQFSPAWWAGVGAHGAGALLLFPLVYAGLVRPRLSGSGWQRGLQWGAVLWAISELVVTPALGRGSPAESDDRAGQLLGSAVLDGTYGAVLGALLGRPDAAQGT